MSGGLDRRVLVVVLAVVLVVAIVAGLRVVGSPGDERGRRLDDERVSDLQNLRQAIDGQYRRDRALPASLEELARRWPVKLRITEPEAGQAYRYEVIDSVSYRLCATFAFASTDEENPRSYYDKEWAHGAGSQCFRFRVRHHDRDDTPRPDDAAGPILEGSSDSTP